MTPNRSVAERLGRWFTGADRKEAEAKEQAAAEERARVAAVAEQTRKAAAAQAEQERQARAAAERKAQAAAERVAREQARAVEVEKGMRAVTVSQEPLVQFETEYQTYHMRREDWQKALDTGATDVPLCEWNGEPVAEGEREKMRVSTVKKAVLTPKAMPTAEQYRLHQEDQGESLSASL